MSLDALAFEQLKATYDTNWIAAVMTWRFIDYRMFAVHEEFYRDVI